MKHDYCDAVCDGCNAPVDSCVCGEIEKSECQKCFELVNHVKLDFVDLRRSYYCQDCVSMWLDKVTK